jgi:hypothetical protein
MVWEHFKVLLPSMTVHLLATVVFFVLAWFVLSRWAHEIKSWGWKTFAALGFFVSVYSSANTFTSYLQNGVVQEKANQIRQETQAAAEAAENKQRGEFLQNIDAIAQNPALATEENKKKLQEGFPALFQNQKLREVYFNNIANLLSCRKVFLLDAVESMKKKEVTLSQNYQTCNQLPGEFFGRKFLVDEQVQAGHQQLLSQLLGRAPAAEGQKTPTKTELEGQAAQVDQALKAIQFVMQ